VWNVVSQEETIEDAVNARVSAYNVKMGGHSEGKTQGLASSRKTHEIRANPSSFSG